MSRAGWGPSRYCRHGAQDSFHLFGFFALALGMGFCTAARSRVQLLVMLPRFAAGRWGAQTCVVETEATVRTVVAHKAAVWIAAVPPNVSEVLRVASTASASPIWPRTGKNKHDCVARPPAVFAGAPSRAIYIYCLPASNMYHDQHQLVPHQKT